MLLKWCMYASVSAEGLELKSHLEFIYCISSLFLAFSCLHRQPLTLSTLDLQRNHVTNMCKPKKKVNILFLLADSYLISSVYMYPIPHFCCTHLMYWFSQFKQQLSSFSILMNIHWIFNGCLFNPVTTPSVSKCLYIIHMKDLNMKHSQRRPGYSIILNT